MIAPSEEFWFDERAADKACEFFAQLPHIKGRLAGKPFNLEPWQRERIVRPLFGWKRIDGTRKYRTAYIEIPRKNGKALALDTPVPTPTGWTTMGEIKIGDQVFDENGDVCNVVAVSGVMRDRKIYRVNFSNGESIVACSDHQWVTSARVDSVGSGGKGRSMTRWKEPTLTINRGYAFANLWQRQKYLCRADDPQLNELFTQVAAADLEKNPVGQSQITRPRTTQEIFETQSYGARGDRNHSVAMPSPIELPSRDFSVSPYILGAWLGDGNTDSACVTCGDVDCEEMAYHLESEGCLVTKRRDRTAWRLRLKNKHLETHCGRGHQNTGRRCRACERECDHLKRNGTPRDPVIHKTIQEYLRDAGVLGDKHIPAKYLRSSKEQRLSLLQGLMDTDGTVNSRGTVFEFCTTNPVLCEDVRELLSSLGVKHSLRTGNLRCNGRAVDGTKYRIQFCTFRDILPVFRLSRKLERMRYSSQGNAVRNRSLTMQISSVEEAETVPVQCIQVDSDSHQFLVGKSMIPTHNSTLCAGIALYLLFCDGEQGAEVYSVAGTREQALAVFDPAEAMVRQVDWLNDACRIFKSQKRVVYKNSFYKAMAADADPAHGLNPHGIIFDELHVQPNRELWDALQTGQGARSQPLTVAITTAGYDRSSICWEQHEYARRVNDPNDPLEDDSFLGVIFGADETDDWTDPAVWKKANPNYGVSIYPDFLEAELAKAKDSPAYENTFRRLFLNQWTEQDVRWMPMEHWDACGGELESLEGRECYIGLDLASVRDLASMVLVFPDGDKFDVIPFFWCPKEAATKRDKQDRQGYLGWAGTHIELTSGNSIDQSAIRQKLWECSRKYSIRSVGFDPWNMDECYQQLLREGWPESSLIKYPQSFSGYNEPMKRVLELVRERRLCHGGNPVLRWNASNVVAKEDANGNLRPDKGKSGDKIDGFCALLMGLGMAISGAEPAPTYYETNEVEFV